MPASPSRSHRPPRPPAARAPRNAGTSLELRSKSHQLAEHLRELIARGELTDPLPPSRRWSQQLGVSRRTLDETLHTLRAQGLLQITRKGATLTGSRTEGTGAKAGARRIVRALIHAGYQRHSFVETLGALQERLRVRGVTVRWEFCRPARLREIAARPPSRQELMLLASVPSAAQRLFAQRGHAAIVLGETGSGVTLPFVNIDQAGAVRHAVFQLLQHGIRELHLVHAQLDSVGIASAVAAFQAAARVWDQGPVTALPHATRLDRPALLALGRKLTRTSQDRRGFIVLAPVPFTLIATALLQQGIAIPRQAELVALFHAPDAAAVFPAFTHYQAPMARVVHHLTEAAMSFFQTGEIASMRKTLLAERKRVE